MDDKYFVETIKKYDMTDPLEILNWYRNLYFKEDYDTERYIMAWAINEMFVQYKEALFKS